MNKCSHTKREPRRRGTAIWEQCLDCWQAVGSAISKSKFTLSQIESMPPFDEEMRNKKGQEEFKARTAHHAAEREQKSEEWWEKYTTHLASENWAHMRLLVLERDNNLCQGCLSARASHVHHKTYEHLGCEFAFELVSLCRDCHERFHNRAFNMN